MYVVEYVPVTMPTVRTKANPSSAEPPKMRSVTAAKNVVSGVRIVALPLVGGKVAYTGS
jgi:hypothetical protein